MKHKLKFIAVFVLTALCLTACADSNIDSNINSDRDGFIVTQDQTEVVLPDISVVTEASKTPEVSESISSSKSNENTDDGGGLLVDAPAQNQNNDANAYAYDDEVTLFLPKTETEEAIVISSDKIEKVSTKKASLSNKIGDLWYANSRGITPSRPVLYDASKDEVVDLIRPEDFPDWIAGSGYKAMLQDRYLFEWLSYDDSTMKLTRIDTQTKTLEVLREEGRDFPGFIYLKELDDEHFFSYYRYNAPEDDEFDLYCVCEIFDINGNYTELVREGFKRDEKNSTGFFYDAFAAQDGVIYGLGKEIINGKVIWTLRTLSNDGEVISYKRLYNMSYMYDAQNIDKFDIVGDYMVTYSKDKYISCVYKKDQLVMKGLRSISYVVTDDMIVCQIYKDEDGKQIDEGLLYVIDTTNDRINKFTFPVEDDSEGSSGIKKCGNGDIRAKYSTYTKNTYYVYYVISKDAFTE